MGRLKSVTNIKGNLRYKGILNRFWLKNDRFALKTALMKDTKYLIWYGMVKLDLIKTSLHLFFIAIMITIINLLVFKT